MTTTHDVPMGKACHSKGTDEGGVSSCGRGMYAGASWLSIAIPIVAPVTGDILNVEGRDQ